MNWLAHLLLSGPSPAAQIGGILPDFANAAELKAAAQEFQAGIKLHHQIDAFTDAHPVVKESVKHVQPRLRRFGGVFVDVYYDHFLSVAWESYSRQPLSEFAQAVYDAFEEYQHKIPPSAWQRLENIRAADILCSYQDIEGVRTALTRIGSRMRRPLDLTSGADELESHCENFRDDFARFFPELVNFVRSNAPNA